MKNSAGHTVCVVAVHPDDETLGCGGTLLRHRANGDRVFWVIITTIHGNPDYSPDAIFQRDREIKQVAEAYGFEQTIQLGYPTTKLDRIPQAELVQQLRRVFTEIHPEILYVPFSGDAHGDHRIVADALHAATKIFRTPSLRAVRAMEVLSETNFPSPSAPHFSPNYYVDITPYLEQKIAIMKLYESELGDHPFPRSEEAVRAQAALRGTECGFHAAEAFHTLFERWGESH